MYRLVSKADGSFQILDDEGENHGVFGDQKEALAVMDNLNYEVKFPNIKPTLPKVPPVTEKPLKVASWAKPDKKTLKKSTVIKKSPLPAKRGRPKKR